MSGLIFVALALVWAVALLPKALRHHDELAQTRSVDGVSDGMRVLARREAISEREARLVVAAPTPPARLSRADQRDRLKVRVAAQRKAAAVAARRRRRILLALLVTTSGVCVAAGLGRLPLWAIGIPVAAMVGFLVLARVIVRREHRRWDAEVLELKVLASTAPAVPDEPVVEVEPQAEPEAEPEAEVEVQVAEVHNAQGLAVVSGLDDTSSFPRGLLDDVTPTTDAGSLWDPLPVTLPTYVSKPRATRSVRTIDLQAPGVSSSGHDAASSALVAEAATSAPPDDLPQRAVGS